MPKNRPTIYQITPDVVEAFRVMQTTADKKSDQWWNAHNYVHEALGFYPWEWPAFDDVEDGACPQPQNNFTEARWHIRRQLYEDLTSALGPAP